MKWLVLPVTALLALFFGCVDPSPPNTPVRPAFAPVRSHEIWISETELRFDDRKMATVTDGHIDPATFDERTGIQPLHDALLAIFEAGESTQRLGVRAHGEMPFSEVYVVLRTARIAGWTGFLLEGSIDVAIPNVEEMLSAKADVAVLTVLVSSESIDLSASSHPMEEIEALRKTIEGADLDGVADHAKELLNRYPDSDLAIVIPRGDVSYERVYRTLETLRPVLPRLRVSKIIEP